MNTKESCGEEVLFNARKYLNKCTLVRECAKNDPCWRKKLNSPLPPLRAHWNLAINIGVSGKRGEKEFQLAKNPGISMR
jgi:hypothetical protein